CRRSNTDPLLQIMLKKYHLHLLEWPRLGVEAGDLVIEKRGGHTLRTRISTVFKEAPASLSAPGKRAMADIEETFSNKVDSKGFASLLAKAAAVLGIDGSAKMESAYQKAATVRVRLRRTEYQDIDTEELSIFLSSAGLRQDQGLFS